MNRFLLLALAGLFASAVYANTSVTADITVNTTWDAAGSPYLLEPGASGGVITVRDGAILTIDASGGDVEIEWHDDYDLNIGDGSSGQGTLVLYAPQGTGTITFKVYEGGNIRIASNGRLQCNNEPDTAFFENFMTDYWGALVFEAGQTRQSEVKNCTFTRGGQDGQMGMVVVEASSSNLPRIENVEFFDNNSGSAAIRCNGVGLDVLRQGNVILPLAATDVEYIFYLDSVASSAQTIRFPQVDCAGTPAIYMSGSCGIGQSSTVSHWRFDESYTFKCASSSSLVTNWGSVWGTAQARVTFEASSGNSSTHWTGLVDQNSGNSNEFGGVGPFAFLTVRNASIGVDIDKGNSFVPQAGTKTVMRFPGLVVKKCDTGIRVGTHIDTGSNNAGYTVILEDTEVGDPGSSDECNAACIVVNYGRVVIDGSRIRGAVTSGVVVGTVSATNTYDVAIRNSTLTDSVGTSGVLVNSSQGAGAVAIYRSIIEGYKTAVDFFQTSTGAYTPTRSLALSHSFLSAKNSASGSSEAAGLRIEVQTNATCTVTVEDCTISGVSGADTNYGLKLMELRSGSTFSATRTIIDGNTDYGVFVVSETDNTCEYTFVECSITGNGNGGTNEGGIHDARTQSAQVVARRCTFASNDPYDAYDASAPDLNAGQCYWQGGSSTGGGQVHDGDQLSGPYFAWLIGGSPAGAAALRVKESATIEADHLHLIANSDYYVAWDFSSDFNGQSQSAYKIEIDDSEDFGSLVHNGTKTTSSSTAVQIATTLTDGTRYYLRVRLWDAEDRAGPWYYTVFRLNDEPAQVSNTTRLPNNQAAETDWTPVFQWVPPTDANMDSLHFEVYLEEGGTNYTVRSWTTSSSSGAGTLDARSSFEFTTDSGTSWLPVPQGGVPCNLACRVRLTWPNAYALPDQTSSDPWIWKVRAWDGFEFGTDSDTWEFELARAYTFGGKLFSSVSTTTGRTIALCRNGSLTVDTAITNGTSDFVLTTNLALLRGDILTIFLDDDPNDKVAARVFQFSGDDMDDLDLTVGRALIGPANAGNGLDNTAFAADSGEDDDIPWDWDSDDLAFTSALDGPGNGVFLGVRWDASGDVDGTQSVEVELNVEVGGHFRNCGYEVSFHKLTNHGRVEIIGAGPFVLSGDDSFSFGHLSVHGGTLRLDKPTSGGLTLFAMDGTVDVANSVIDSTGGHPGTLAIDGGALSCINTTFGAARVEFGTDAIMILFENIKFQSAMLGQNIVWHTTNTMSSGIMRNIQFNCSIGGGDVNVDADTGMVTPPLVLWMIGCGGIGSGESFEDDPWNAVIWHLTPPTGLKVEMGDTRLRLTWDNSPQAAASGFEYYVYRSTSAAGPFSEVSGGVTTNEFVDTSLSNGTVYHYFTTIVDTNPTIDVESAGSNRVQAAPADSSIDGLAPSDARATSVLALSVFGSNTHWDGSTSVTVTKGGGSNLVVNDWLVISPALALVDVTLGNISGPATTGSWTVTTTANDIWGISSYDEVETATLTVGDDATDLTERPTLAFTTSNGGIAADASTSGAFTFNIDFTDQGGGVDDATLEVYATRDVTLSSSNVAMGTELRGAGLSIDTLNSSRATWTINQSSGTELFADGEYLLYARVEDSDGQKSEWASIRFFVEGGSASVLICTDRLLQGATFNVTVAGTGLNTGQTVSFGSNITVNSVSGSSSSMTVNITVDELAACGPRQFTANNGSKTGIATVEFPTSLLPTTTNAEPSRSAGTAGINVFLANGAFFKSETDLATPGRMLGLSWSRFYRSDISYDGPLGNNWVGHYFQRAIVDGNNDINWYTADGRKEVFPDVTGGYSNPAGIYVRATFEPTHGVITLTDRNGHKCMFNKDGRLWRCVDQHGNFIECSYNFLGQLVLITDDRAKSWEVHYFDHGRVETVADKVWHTSTPREISYVYDSAGDLIEHKAPTTDRYDGSLFPRITSGYRYDSAHRLVACINPREFAQGSNPIPYLENFYDDQGRVTDQKLGRDADVVDTVVPKSAFIRLRYESSTIIREVDRSSRRTDYTIDASARIASVKRFTEFWSVDTQQPYDHSAKTSIHGKLRSGDPASFESTFTYNSNHEVLTTTSPRLNKVIYTYPNGSLQTSGTATTCSDREMADTGASWTPDAFVGMTLRMGTDASNYRYYPITGNTSEEITVAVGFDLDTGYGGDQWGTGSAYAVYSQDADPMAAGNVLTVTRSDESITGVNEPDIVTTYTYEPRYQLVKTVKDPRGHTTIFTYDYEESELGSAESGKLMKVETPTINGSMAAPGTIISRTTYNQYGQPVASVDGEGNVTRMVYYSSGDNEGFLKNRITAWGSFNLKSEYAYDNVGNTIASWSPRAFDQGVTQDDFKTSHLVNELNQVWSSNHKVEVGAAGSLTLVTVDSYSYFDANGNLTNSYREYITDGGTSPSLPGDLVTPGAFAKSGSPMAATWVESSATYNLLNRPVTNTVDAIAGSAVTQYTSRTVYDSSYAAYEHISPMGNKSRTIYDERGLVFQSVSGADSDVVGTTRSDYDANGNTLSSFDSRGNETTYQYDGFDRTVKVIDPAGHYRTTAYDATSNVVESKSFDHFGVLLSHSTSTYDEINRSWKTQKLANDFRGLPIGDGWATNVSVLDKNSRTVSSTNDNGVTHWTSYDGANRVRFSRDAVGNEVWPEYNSHGVTVKTVFREINPLSAIVEVSHEEVELTKQDSVLASKDRRWSSGFDTRSQATYDGWGRVTRRTLPGNSGSNYVDHEYDLLSRTTRTTEITGGDVIITVMEYDADGRVKVRAIQNDPISNTYQQTRYDYDERGRMIKLQRPDGDIWQYFFDAASNQTGWLDPVGTRVTNTFDERNLLTYRAIERGTGIVGPTSETYAYDGLGRVTSCANHDGSQLITASSWDYNTLSLSERLTQTVVDPFGDLVGTYTTGAEFDASGFNRAMIYSDGRRVVNFPDALNRLASTYDMTADKQIASYAIAGPGRLVQRDYGNGTRSNYDYEASGCGCGGATPFCTKVKHTHIGDNITLWGVERRYDLRGLVTAESSDHDGNVGNVYRYDGANRLTNTFFGVNLWDDISNAENLTVMSDPTQTPSTFAMSRAYDLDSRGNRAGSTGVLDEGDNANTIKGHDYAVSTDDMNKYASLDGSSYTYDAIEQMTQRPGGGMDEFEYDYKGNLAGAGGTQNVTYLRDNKGRLMYEVQVDEEITAATLTLNTAAQPSGCYCGSADTKQEEHTFGSLGASAGMIHYYYGLGMMAPGSSSAEHPANVAYPSEGALAGCFVIGDASFVFTSEEWRTPQFYYENQSGSIIGQADDAGNRTHEWNYTDYGTVENRPIILDGRPGNRSAATYNSGNDRTSVTFTALPFLVEFEGSQIRVARPGQSSDQLTFWHVESVTGIPATTLIFDDPGAVLCDLINSSEGFTVLPFYQDYWGGVWSSVHYDSMNDQTVFEGDFGTEVIFSTGAPSVTAGMMVVPNLAKPAALHVVSAAIDQNGTDELRVTGDVTSMAGVTSFRIQRFAFQRYEPGNDDPLGNDPVEAPPRHQWNSYRAMPSLEARAGEIPYLCWNRLYLPEIGRWTATDQLPSNSLDPIQYCRGNPLGSRDPSGLLPTELPSAENCKDGDTFEIEEWLGGYDFASAYETQIDSRDEVRVGSVYGYDQDDGKCYQWEMRKFEYRFTQLLKRRWTELEYHVKYKARNLATYIQEVTAFRDGYNARLQAATELLGTMAPGAAGLPGKLAEIALLAHALHEASEKVEEAQQIEKKGFKMTWVQESAKYTGMAQRQTSWAKRDTPWQKGQVFLRDRCEASAAKCKDKQTYRSHRLWDVATGQYVSGADAPKTFDPLSAEITALNWTNVGDFELPRFVRKGSTWVPNSK